MFVFLLSACGGASSPPPQHPTRPEAPVAQPVQHATGSGSTYIHISDIHLDLSGKSSDTDPALWTITKAQLTQIIKDSPPKFILYTGDLPGHYDCAPDVTDCALTTDQKPDHEKNETAVLADLKTVAGTIPLIYVTGNNDALDGDYFSFTNSAGQSPDALVPGYPVINAATTCGTPPCIVSNPTNGFGYYSVRPVDGLRVIALNTILFGEKYYSSDGHSQTDAGNAQMTWLKDQLSNLGTDKVLLAMHIPPGRDAYAVSKGKTDNSMWTRSPNPAPPTPQAAWLDQVLDLMDAHKDAIVGFAYGHTHMEELRRTRNHSNAINEVGIGAPGITTNHGNNPGFKVVSYDSSSKELTDYMTYWTTRGSAAWGTEQYQFSSAYKCVGKTILACLSQPSFDDPATVASIMNTYFYLNPQKPGFSDSKSGIDVEYGQ